MLICYKARLSSDPCSNPSHTLSTSGYFGPCFLLCCHIKVRRCRTEIGGSACTGPGLTECTHGVLLYNSLEPSEPSTPVVAGADTGHPDFQESRASLASW